jgi:hypothetical protein
MVRLIDPSLEPAWDRFVANHPLGWLCHLSGWKKVIEGAFDHMEAHYLALYDKRNEEIVAGLPLFKVKSAITGHRLVSLPFATLSDPLVSSGEQMDELLDAAFDLMKKVNASYIEVKTRGSTSMMPTNRLSGINFYKNHYLPLGAPLENVRSSFHRSCVRQRITRAVKSGLVIRTGENKSDLRAFYTLHVATRKRLGLPAPPFSLLEGLWDTFSPSGNLSLLLSDYQGKAVAGIVVLKFRDRMSGEFLGWEERYRDMSPTHHIFWEAIKLADKEGRLVFDFGRSSPMNSSLAEFKSRWGTSVVDLPQYYYPPKAGGKVDQEKSLIRKVVREACRRAPDPAFRVMSSICFRHMG